MEVSPIRQQYFIFGNKNVSAENTVFKLFFEIFSFLFKKSLA